MRRQQMFGTLGDRGFQGFVGGLAGAERGLEGPVRPPDVADQDRGEQQDQQRAGEIDREQDETRFAANPKSELSAAAVPLS